MKTSKKNLRLVLVAAISLLFSFCSKDDPEPSDGESEIVYNTDVELPTDEGEVGLVIDTRDFFRKGYVAETAEVTFSDYPDLNTALDIDPATNLAIVNFSNEDLTEEQKNAFAQGTAINIKIKDENSGDLVSYDNASQILDNSNQPLVIPCPLPAMEVPVVLADNVSYLLQPYGEDGLITTTCSSCMPIHAFQENSTKQEFIFEPVEGKEDTYKIVGEFDYGDPDNNGSGTYFSIGQPNIPQYVDANWIFMMDETYAEEFVLEQDVDYPGYVRIKSADDRYLTAEAADLKLNAIASTKGLFRLISDEITWNAVDQGAQYNDPVIPPTQLDFAYEATIRNCTSGILTETVGNSQSRTSTSTVTTSESLQLFASVEVGYSATIGMEVGGELYGATGSVEATLSGTLTTSATSTTENTISSTTEDTSEVSRTRELQIQPFSGVEVYDAIRIVNNVRIPFTQTLRISGTYKNSGESLSGDEIVTQLLFNLSGGIPSAIGADYVDVSIRGSAIIDQMFEAETGANQIDDACN